MLGFIGVGTIAAAIIKGLRRAGINETILLSPRNAVLAKSLAKNLQFVDVAPSNQAVVDGSDLVFLCVRPQIAKSVLSELYFSPGKQVASLVATKQLSELESVIPLAGRITRAAPLPAVSLGEGATAIYPPDDRLASLFRSLGIVAEIEDEPVYEAFTAVTAVMASYFQLASAVTDWMVRQGAEPAAARVFVGQMLSGLARTSNAQPTLAFAELAGQHQTAGGLNEQLLEVMNRLGASDAMNAALDGVFTRLKAQPASLFDDG